MERSEEEVAEGELGPSELSATARLSSMEGKKEVVLVGGGLPMMDARTGGGGVVRFEGTSGDSCRIRGWTLRLSSSE